MKKGLVIGKFYPLHKGHNYLIDYAASQVDELDVLICDHPSYTIPAHKRLEWVQAIHPNVRAQTIPDIEDDNNSPAWGKHTVQFLGYKPDVVFSSEDYGITYAAAMGSKHVMVDKKRKHVPISARYIRADLLKHWDYLAPQVKADLCYRICIVGAESTGTTTLSRALAEYYRAPWVPEFGRTYTEALQFHKTQWNSEEFLHIATEQQRMEDDLAARSNGILICDTNAFATQLWEERYVGSTLQKLQNYAFKNPMLYILTDVNIPFEQDGIRDGEHVRYDMHHKFIKVLDEQNVPYILVSGTKNERLKTAINTINTLLRTGNDYERNTEITGSHERQLV